VEKEVRFLRKAADSRSIHVISYVTDYRNPAWGHFLVMHPLCHETMLSFIQRAMKTPDFQLFTAVNFVQQICKGLKALRKVRLYHGDLALRNILLTEDGTVLLSDFGVSLDDYPDGVLTDFIVKVNSATAPPEAVIGEETSTGPLAISGAKADCWALGVCSYMICCRTTDEEEGPEVYDQDFFLQLAGLPSEEKISRLLRELKEAYPGQHIPDPLIESISGLLTTSPAQRLDVDQTSELLAKAEFLTHPGVLVNNHNTLTHMALYMVGMYVIITAIAVVMKAPPDSAFLMSFLPYTFFIIRSYIIFFDILDGIPFLAWGEFRLPFSKLAFQMVYHVVLFPSIWIYLWSVLYTVLISLLTGEVMADERQNDPGLPSVHQDWTLGWTRHMPNRARFGYVFPLVPYYLGFLFKLVAHRVSAGSWRLDNAITLDLGTDPSTAAQSIV